MAKPYKDGAGWAYRLRVAGRDVYRSGFKTAARAKEDMERVRQELTQGPAQSGLGPYRTSLGVAFMDYARQRLPYLKGADQDSRRINRFLRALQLPVVALSPVEMEKEGKRVYWEVAFVEECGRTVRNSLLAHRVTQAAASAESDKRRAGLARMNMADVTTHHIQAYLDALRAEGKKSATVHLERSELRRLFRHASAVWKWRHAGGNPAGADLDMPELDAGRDRVLTNEEWERISQALLEYRNPHVAPLACLMLETAMRSCEPLTSLRWRDINWTRRVLELPDAKTGRRLVPLSPGAIVILGELAQRAKEAEEARQKKQKRQRKPVKPGEPYGPDARVFPTTYEAVKKAWSQACKAAEVEGVRLHDLRHTSATRYALEYKGNLPVIMLITGHKTTQMAMRYINLKADDVVRMMHGDDTDKGTLPAGYRVNLAEGLSTAVREREAVRAGENASGTEGASKPAEVAQTVRGTPQTVAGNLILVAFGRRAA
ncbi:tyrosine-type recombinase/integrase [Aromatoleum petrolei]|uniref:Tyrosine-type recombinase/integrase n=1 Tax=Aromatoleum petrolei TaxID=76116 RepID=A0ABX1MLN6_9RHOO|nr:site-specific integrase [Aromatoleum petrolei]NMF86934.1 tyrosine-type recombinase/integrase [Aromatoleum petrolei]QTQ37527.1 Putative integrase [Aromatoleum petrolei]